MDQPDAARSPAQTLQTENCEPMEISIWRQMMTRAIPHATTSAGASRVRRERRGWGEKNAGAKEARMRRRTRRAQATEISRKWRERNSKFEIRNPKQFRSSKFECGALTGLSRFEFRVCFDIRISDFALYFACPRAAAITSWAVDLAGSMATIVPPRMTAIRSLMPIISGRSEEIIRTARP
jgi:hypothetical protein